MTLVDQLFDRAEHLVRDGPDNPFTPMVGVQRGERPFEIAPLKPENFKHRHQVLRDLVTVFEPNEMCLCYDGYMTRTTTDPCPDCLGEEGGCDTCRGTGHALDGHGRREAIIVVELQKGAPPIIHTRPYVRVEGRILFDDRCTTPLNGHLQSEYPTL